MFEAVLSSLRRSGPRGREGVAPWSFRLEPLEDRRLLIVNGATTSGWPAVVNVGGASGVLITPTSVLTAAHCGSTSVRIGGKAYTAAEVIRHPAYSANTNDLAVVRLSEPVTGIAPIPILRSRPYVGQPTTLVGFGLGGTDAGTIPGSGGVKRAGSTRIDGVTPTLLAFAFQTRGEANIASGDSGGPAIVQVAGVNHVAGIAMGHTVGSSALGDTAYETRVDAYASWIDSACRAPLRAVAGITVTPTTGLVTAEFGSRATFTVRLRSQPAADVTIGVSSSDTTEGTVSTTALVFTPGNWNVPQTVTVVGVDDWLVDGAVSYRVVTAPAVSSDAAYNRLDAADVTLTNLDDDVDWRGPIVVCHTSAAGRAGLPPSPYAAEAAIAAAFAGFSSVNGDEPTGSRLTGRPRTKAV